MIRAFYFEGESLASVDDPAAAALAWREKRPLWVHAEPEELYFLSDVCGFHPLAIEECERETPVPKVEDFGAYLFAELHLPICIGDRLEVYELDIFIGRDFLVTYARQEIPGFSPLLGNRKNIAKRLPSPPRLLRAILNQTVFQNLWELLEDLDDRMDAIEEQLSGWNLSQSVFRRITATNGVLGRIKKTLIFHQRLLEELADEARELFSAENMPYLLDIVDRNYRILSEADYIQQRAETLYQTFVDSRDYQSNEIMKVLTVVATVTLPAVLIASIYGMNFKHMPELEQWWGYPAALAVMLIIGILLFIYMKRKKWL